MSTENLVEMYTGILRTPCVREKWQHHWKYTASAIKTLLTVSSPRINVYVESGTTLRRNRRRKQIHSGAIVRSTVFRRTVCLKLLNPITTTVTLSKDLLKREFFITYSTPIPQILWMSLAWFFTAGWNLLSWTALQTHEIDSLFSNLSKMPSQPRMIKSCSLTILNFLISGLWITHLGFPPRATILASGSPKVLATESLPGSTLSGPAKFNS